MNPLSTVSINSILHLFNIPTPSYAEKYGVTIKILSPSLVTADIECSIAADAPIVTIISSAE